MTAVYIILGLLALLILFMIVRTAIAKPVGQISERPELDGPDKDKLTENLSKAVQIPTVSMQTAEFPDRPFYDYADYLEKTYPLFHKAAKKVVVNKYSLCYSIEGSDPSLKPVCLLAHMDVVPAPAEGWEVPPFSGEIKDGFVYGRGSQDMKCQMIAALDAMEYMLANGISFKRSVYLCFGHDEELATFDGAPEIVKYLQAQNIEFEYVIDEGGTMIDGSIMGIKGTLALIGTCEKGYMDVVLSASKSGGHASTPGKPTVLASIGRALYMIEKKQMKAKWTQATKDMFKELAPFMNPLFKFLFINRDILSPLIKLALVLVSPITAALVKTTFAPTMAKGSNAANVLPPYGEATVNCRILPGDTPESILEHMRKVAGKNVTLSTPIEPVKPCPASPIDTESYRQLVKTIREVFPGLIPAPYLFIAATDSRYFYPVCKCVYRFTPFVGTEEDLKRIHALNERVSIDSLHQAAQFFVRLMRNTCM